MTFANASSRLAASSHLPHRLSHRHRCFVSRQRKVKPGHSAFLYPAFQRCRGTDVLTDRECREATCPIDRPRLRVSDGAGLYLECAPNGSKRWFWKYYPDGKESRLALGRYPEVTLKAARLARDKARLEYKGGTDPLQARRLAKIAARHSASDTFAAVAREYHALKAPSWSATYAERWLRQVEKDLCPWIGNLDLRQITAPVLLDALRRVERRGVNELAHSLRQAAGQIMRYGVQTGRCERSPAQDLAGALRPVQTVHMAAILEPVRAGELMRSIAGYSGQPLTRLALLLSAYTFQRPGNVRAMRWADVDLAEAMWRIPADQMKRTKAQKINGRPHLVPLSRQAVEALQEAQRYSAGGVYVFPALTSRKRPMSENTIRQALLRMGYDDHTPHGFRAMARTLIAERLPFSPDVIEAQLAHVKSGPLGSAYDRADYVEQRRQMMAAWSNYLDGLTVSNDSST